MRARSAKLMCLAMVVAGVSACATPRMHSEDELNSASLACGLTYGEMVQDEEEKKLLILFHEKPNPAQRGCAYQWARKNHLKLVVIDGIQFPEEEP
jgi:hypothetical protein